MLIFSYQDYVAATCAVAQFILYSVYRSIANITRLTSPKTLSDSNVQIEKKSIFYCILGLENFVYLISTPTIKRGVKLFNFCQTTAGCFQCHQVALNSTPLGDLSQIEKKFTL